MTFEEKEILEKICEPLERLANINAQCKREETATQTRVKNAIISLWDEFLKEYGNDVSNFCNAVDIMTEYFLATSADDVPTPFWSLDENEFVRVKAFVFTFLRHIAKLSIIFENDYEAQTEEIKRARATEGAQNRPEK